MDNTTLDDAYGTFLEAVARIEKAEATLAGPPAGQWNANQILAHVCLVTATTIAAAANVAAGCHTTYDNRITLDPWTINRVVDLSGGTAGLRDRLRRQSRALCALDAQALAEPELDTPVPTRLISNGDVLVDGPAPLRDLIAGLAETELPGHTKQLLNLVPN